jgi:DNA-binding transcriptional ArsR family regulator
VPRPRRTEQLSEPIAPICEDFVVHLDAVRTAQRSLPHLGELDRLSSLFATLGDPTRLRIVAALSAHELCVCDLAAVVGLSESAVSHHLRQLRSLELVKHRREGRLALYSLNDEHVNALYQQASVHIAHQANKEDS